LRRSLFHALGLRFRAAGWIAIAVLIITGLVNLHYRGLLRWNDVLANAAFWSTALGTALAAKLTAVGVMIATAAVHDFIVGPAAGRAEAGSADAERLRRITALLGRLNALVGVVLVLAAVRLARGG
jgi:hypothetical protein